MFLGAPPCWLPSMERSSWDTKVRPLAAAARGVGPKMSPSCASTARLRGVSKRPPGPKRAAGLGLDE